MAKLPNPNSSHKAKHSKPRDTNIPITYLSECFSLGACTGSLTWKRRPLSHFINENAWAAWNAKHGDKNAGSRTSKGYEQINLTIKGQRYRVLAHRIIFALTKGRWPADQLDHKDRNKITNKIENLREATNAQNHQNMGLRSDNKSSVTGAGWNKRSRKWRVEITVNGHVHCRGAFVRKDDAIKARLAAEEELHPFAPRAKGKGVRP